MNKISNSGKSLYDPIITEDEILQRDTMKKSPGTGGFPSEFYIFVGIEIKTILINTILYEVENEELSIE